MDRKVIDPPYEIFGVDFLGEHSPCITEISSEELLMSMIVDEEHLNVWGMAHGGVIFTLADAAAGHLTVESSGKACVTISGNLNFIKPVYPGKLEALAHMEHLGKTTSVVRVDVMQEGKIVSVATFTFHILSTPINKKIMR